MLIYLGTDTDGNACGTAELSDHLASSALLASVEDRRNTLLILGDPVGIGTGTEYRKTFTGEDVAGLLFRGGFLNRWVTFEQAQEYASSMNALRNPEAKKPSRLSPASLEVCMSDESRRSFAFTADRRKE